MKCIKPFKSRELVNAVRVQHLKELPSTCERPSSEQQHPPRSLQELEIHWNCVCLLRLVECIPEREKPLYSLAFFDDPELEETYIPL